LLRFVKYDCVPDRALLVTFIVFSWLSHSRRELT
jgi:hypothetical protein